jgi:eukaryotic-like serine/threonine-protein kinase
MTQDVSLDTAYWKRVDALLVVALGLPPERRQAWLDSLDGENLQLKPVITRLLERTDAETDAFMGKPALLNALDGETHPAYEDKAGDTIGPYRLISLIGTGGMGAVWLAQQSHGAVVRDVALKLPRSGWNPGLADRLKRECSILSKLEHPHIARLYDAGLAEKDRPYLAMEYIEGIPIDQYCRESRLGVEATLRLFLMIADAIAYAHGRLVVHRDLKPSNILVDTKGGVHVVDFGLAKLLDADASPHPAITRQGGRAFTPSYASPEQIIGGDISVGSDVYSLGVLLFELLTGARPYELKRESVAALEEAILTADALPASRVPGLDAPTARALRGDIENILAKALAKKIDQRYSTIEAFATDVRLHLDGQPVSAHAMSFSYRAGKFIRRNRLVLGAAVLLACAVLAGVAGILHQARRADAEARQASLERDKALQELQFAEAAEELSRFLLSEQSARKATSTDMLGRGEKLVAVQFSANPRLHSRLLLLLADLYGEAMDFKRAEAVLLKAIELTKGPDDFGLQAQARCTLAGVYGVMGRRPEAQEMFTAVFAGLGPQQESFADGRMTCHVQRGTFLRNSGNMAGALSDYQAALGILDRTKPGPRFDRVHMQLGAASALSSMGRLAESIKVYEQGMADIERMGRSETTAGLIQMNNYLSLLTRAGHHRKAEETFHKLQASLASQGGLTDTLQINFARVLNDLGRSQEAIEMVEPAVASKAALGDKRGEVFAMLVKAAATCEMNVKPCGLQVEQLWTKAKGLFPEKHSFFSILKMLGAQEQVLRGRHHEAAAQFGEAIDGFLAAPDRSPLVVRALARQAVALQKAGDAPAAKQSATRALEIASEYSRGLEGSTWVGVAQLAQAEILLLQGDKAAALPLAQAALSTLTTHAGDSAPLTRQAAQLVRQLQTPGQ